MAPLSLKSIPSASDPEQNATANSWLHEALCVEKAYISHHGMLCTLDYVDSLKCDSFLF